MATATILPSNYSRGNSTYLTVSSASNMYTNTSSTTRGSVQHTRNSTSSSYTYNFYLRGFDFSGVPENAIVSDFSIKVKASESNLNTGSSYYIRLYNYDTVISGTTVSTALSTSAKVITIPTGDLTWSEFRALGANLRICFPMRRSSTSNNSYLYVYGAEINVTYELPAIFFKNNGSWIQASRVYKKVNGSWVEQTDLDNVFDPNINYVKG